MKIAFLALCLSLPLAAEENTMKSAADKFLATLDEAQRETVARPFADEARGNFRYTPRERGGMPLKEMSEAQRTAAMDLLKTALSEKGLLKATQIVTLEGVLADLEKRPGFRDAGKYYLTLFGSPGDQSGWGWKFEGHHLSLNYTVANGEVAVTPSFFGANPAEVRQGPHKGLRVLKAEEELARALVQSLSKSGAETVIFSENPPAEILTGEQRKVTALEPVGVLAADMTESQRQALLELISEYTGRHRKDLAEADMRKIKTAGIDKVRFGWAGGTQPGEAWYYRIQGPSFLMEAANTQNQANHIHTTWRDFEGDFGRDLLGEHYHGHEE
jgi:hypothetical protein